MNKTKKGLAALSIGALGVVFGDIGTSPLYALEAAFGVQGHNLAITPTNVYGIVSLVIWSVTIVVSIKYLLFITRADNKGEGGIMALVALVKSSDLAKRYKWFFIVLGLIGVSLFYGDSAITPAISVLSAVGGLKVVAPQLSAYVLPITLVILAGLFWIQKYGTVVIGRLFGPTMLLWFTVLALGGGWQILQHPDALQALSPLQAVNFFAANPLIGVTAMSVVVLAITGAEALYADMGHFGRAPIARSWFFVVFPALALCYMGQGAFILHGNAGNGGALVQMFPASVHIPFILLATLATLIASQSVISGAFSLTRQAIRLGYLPKMVIRFTSENEFGRIYVPFINFLLFVTVTLLVIVFGSSQNLANAFGVAVSGTLLADTILFIVVLRSLWRKSFIWIVGAIVAFVPLDLLFVVSNLPKIVQGGLFPVGIALLVCICIDTWVKGQAIISKERRNMEGTLQSFVDKLHDKPNIVRRIPGQAVYISHHPGFTPLALHAAVNELHELPENVVVLSVYTTTEGHIPIDERASVDPLKYDDGICQVNLTYGFHDRIDIPKTLKSLRHFSPELDFNSLEAAYYVSLTKASPTKRHNMARWRKSLYRLMARNDLSPSDFYNLPLKNTEEIYSSVRL